MKSALPLLLLLVALPRLARAQDAGAHPTAPQHPPTQPQHPPTQPQHPPTQPPQAPPTQPPQAPPVPPGTPRYLPAIQHELDTLGIESTCHADSPTIARCEWHAHGAATAEDFDVHLTYSDDTDTIYFYVAQVAHAPADAPQTPRLLRRLMELNWELLATKLEWNAEDGEVRIATVQNTDSNFDRRTFRSVVRNLVIAADRLANELRSLAAGATNQ